MTKPFSSTDTASTIEDKVYLNQDLWYFDTDAGDTVGPFRYKSEAESNLNRFLAQLQGQLGVEG
ncbi:MAG: DUF6316 family protein [Pseudohongiellaceae bacterium]